MADYGLAAQAGGGAGGGNAFNPLQTVAQYQNISNAMMQAQQFQQQMQQQNALRDILSRSGGKITPEINQALMASGNYEPALALQRHQASMGSIGVQTQAAQTALEKARLELGESKRDIAAKTAQITYLANTPNIADPDKLDALRKENPIAWANVRKHIEDMREATAKADKEGRASSAQMFDLTKKTLNFIEPLLSTVTDQSSYNGVRNLVLGMDRGLGNVIGPEYTPENMLRLKNIAQSTSNMETKELSNGQMIVVNKATGTFSFLKPDGTMAPGGKLADLEGGAAAAPVAAAPPVAPTPGMPAGLATSMNATNAMPRPAAPPANAMPQPPVDPLAAIKSQSNAANRAEELAKFRQQEEIKAEVAANRPATPMTAQQEARMRDSISTDRTAALSTMQTMDDLIKSLNEVRDLPDSAKGSITGLTAYAPPLTPGGRTAETKLANLKGKVTAMGKAATSLTGAIGNMAVQEWKIVMDQIASLDTAKMNVKDLNAQLDIIESQARGAANRIRDAYERQYQEMFEKYPGRFDLKPKSAEGPDIDALLKKYEK
jgi:hypothetical protein